MKKISLSLLLWLFVCGALLPIRKGGGQHILGNDTVGPNVYEGSVGHTRCIPTTTTEGFTVTYGWAYLSTDDDSEGTLQMSIYTDDGGAPGSIVGDCSSVGTIPIDGQEDWIEVTWSPGITLSPNTSYWLCYHASEDLDLFYKSGTAYYQSYGSCPETATNSSSLEVSICVADYDAK